MKNRNKIEAARKFSEFWINRGYEKGESQKFWISFLRDVCEVERPEELIRFEDQVHLDHTSFIDGHIKSTHVLIEQKSIDKDLSKGIKQADGSVLSPFQQAKRYSTELPYSERPRWIVTCNFKEFYIYDMERPSGQPEIIKLVDLEREYFRFNFLTDTGEINIKKETEVSLKAGELVGVLYEEILKQYRNPNDPNSLRSLNEFCVRLVFCLYAEDSGVFGKHSSFHDYLRNHKNEDRGALINLFKVLDTRPEDRDPYLVKDLAAFPYVNGGLFADEDIEIPHLGEKIIDLILKNASEDFDWSVISPTIFGAVFESTLNPDTRRTGGMHYTSIENIHKVIDPLFLETLLSEFNEIETITITKARNAKLRDFQSKIASLKFLDPACGSGNFLTETYLSLRRLENRVISLIFSGQMVMEMANPIKVSIDQFYGIEINDFAVTVAKTALWIAESQMLEETESIVHMSIDFLPLTTNAHIIEANALIIDWQSVVSNTQLNYIMGNPPFVGARLMDQGSIQKGEIINVFGEIDGVHDLDYVTCWYKLAVKMMSNTKIETCFVSTNSICQGAQVPILWNVLLNEFRAKINFAYQTFKWVSESSKQAAVHCVIIGLSMVERDKKPLYSNGQVKYVSNISPYLVEGTDSFVVTQKSAICNVPKMSFGNQPRDGGNFVLTDEERTRILDIEPGLSEWIYPYIGSQEFINRELRWCFWLKKALPSDIRGSKTLYDRVEKVKQFRLASKAKTTNQYAKVPTLFAQITQQEGADFLLIPSVSSERRRYVPIGFLSQRVISSNSAQIIPNATVFHFGVLTSNVHMAWMRAVAGRLKSDYRYSKELVYNTFPWPEETEVNRKKIEQTAKEILDARELYPDSSLADLYDEVTMPSELRKAHQNNDRAVMSSYGFSIKISESECFQELMKLYQDKVSRI